MFCPNCGTKNEDDAVFCANCGTKLELDQQVTQENAVVSEQPAVEVQPVVETQENIQQPQQPEMEAQPVQEQPQFYGQPAQEQFAGQQPQFNGQPVQPQFNGQQAQFNGQPVQPQFAGQQPVAPKKNFNFKLTKKMMGIGAGVLAVIIAIIVFVSVGKAGSDYKKTAKNYAQAVLKCDWDTAFDMVNLPESEFLTKEAYVEVNSDATPKAIAAMTVTDEDIYSSLGLSSEVSLTKDVTVLYSTPGSSQSTMYLTMDLSPKKYMLFFKQYKVSSDSIVSSDISIRVPSGAKLYINDVEVNSSYITTGNSTSKSVDTYKIPFLFDGTNKLKITGDLFEDYETDFTVSYNEDYYSVSSSNLTMKADMLNAVKAQAETDLKAIAENCLANKEVSSLNGRILASESSTVTSCYRYALQDCHSSSKDVKTLTLSNIKTQVKSETLSIDSDDGYPTVQVTLSYSKTGTYAYKSSADNVREGDGSETSDYIRYKYVDGSWMITYFNIDLYIS